jgi:LPXTG-site transpeptidase (sortase) family protein
MYNVPEKRQNPLIILLAVSAFMLGFLLTATLPGSASGNERLTLSIPSIDLQAPVVELELRAFANGDVTWDTATLTTEAGLLKGLSRFGEQGNTVLGGHSELDNRKPTVFYELNKVAVGDEIIVTEAGKQWRYVVTRTLAVAWDDLSVLKPSAGGEWLTLITCDPTSFAGGDYDRRVVVLAERVE